MPKLKPQLFNELFGEDKTSPTNVQLLFCRDTDFVLTVGRRGRSLERSSPVQEDMEKRKRR